MDRNLQSTCNEMKAIENIEKTDIATTSTNKPTVVKNPMAISATNSSSKILKRCLSVPILPPTISGLKLSPTIPTTCTLNGIPEETKTNPTVMPNNAIGTLISNNTNMESGIPASNRPSREVSPIGLFNIFTPKARRYSASYSPGTATPITINANSSRCITPRVSQLRQEECIDINSREVNHEREVHSAIQISQSWEDLTLVAENWSCKSDDINSPLQVVLPSIINTNSSSPSPNSNRGGIRLPYGLSPSPTRRTFATRRSMSPIAIRPSQLGSVKRKFELDDTNSSNSWNIYSQPPPKKIFTDSRDSSPICQSPSVCPSPDSGIYDGRITAKLFVSKLCTSSTANSSCLLPISPFSTNPHKITSDATTPFLNIPSSLLHQSGSSSSSSNGNEQTACIGNSNDEGIVMPENDAEKNRLERVSVDMQDESILMDDTKSETSSIGGCSNISHESSSCDSAIKNLFVNSALPDQTNSNFTADSNKCLPQKHFYINKQGVTGAKKFIVNHDNFSNGGARLNDQQADNVAVTITDQKKIN